MKMVIPLLLAATFPLLIGAGSPSRSTPPAATVSKDVKYYNQGVEAQNRGDYERAAELYRKTLDINPNFPNALNNLGFSLRSIGKRYMDAAMQAYNQALSLDPNHAQALEYQGELYLWTGDLGRARANYERLRNMGSRQANELKEHIEQVVAQARGM